MLTKTYQPSASSPGYDQTMDAKAPDDIAGFGAELAVGKGAKAGSINRAVMAIELDGLPDDLDVLPTSKLELWATMSPAAAAAFSLYPLDITQGDAPTDVVSAECSWNSKSAGVAWGAPGGDFFSHPSSYLWVPILNISIPEPITFTGEGLESIIQQAVDTDERVLRLLIKAIDEAPDPGNESVIRIIPREGPDPTLRPKLIIDYDAVPLSHLKSVIRQRVNSLFGSDYRIAYSNAQFTPRQAETWMAVTIRVGQSNQVSMGSVKRFRTVGVALIQIFTAKNIGPGLADRLADQVIRNFRSVTVDGVVFKTPTPRFIGSSGKWHQLNVECPFTFDDLDT